MSLVVTPELLTSAASDLQRIESDLAAAVLAAAQSTTAIAPAGADEVSNAVAALFSSHGQDCQGAHAEAAALRNQLAQTLAANAETYQDAEDDNADLLAYAAARNRLWQQTHSATRLGGPHAPGSPVDIAWWVWQFEQVANTALKLK